MPHAHTIITLNKQHTSCRIHDMNFIDTLIIYPVKHTVQPDCNRTALTCTNSLLSAWSTRVGVKVSAVGWTKYACHSVMSVSEKHGFMLVPKHVITFG
jgi:hypothetical protein